ncbi:hypothetical protein FJM67_05570 [Maribrevibacterium harenarium]|uniref:Uncharacterized protein n=1 Tax=Maribrevibacterium harenarium TaxID=2589817 RepID=A0A501WWJ1_9GAMM|nr:hypothetical protein [Maribrevibacterium harenarium]TPE54083.1 hypothetical protein FJM67_05570 [Maribrevibacterium harenarium]
MRLIVFLCLCLATPVFAKTVATVSPIAHSMSQALLADTDIKVDYLPPTRLPLNRVASWLDKNRTEPVDSYDAYVTMRSLRPELDFYPTLRVSNIRIVPIDMAVALIPGGEQVARQDNADYFWLNPSNALMMLGILKRDFIALWPEQKQRIEDNYRHTADGLRQLLLSLDEQLLQRGYEGIVLTQEELSPLSQSLMLPTLAPAEAELFHAIVITNRPSDQANQWAVDDFSRFQTTPFLQRWRSNIDQLP